MILLQQNMYFYYEEQKNYNQQSCMYKQTAFFIAKSAHDVFMPLIFILSPFVFIYGYGMIQKKKNNSPI